MDGRRTAMDGWLEAEGRDDEAAAEAAFAQVVQSLPLLAAPPGFAEQVAARAWAARRRARRTMVLTGVAASVVAALAAAAVALSFGAAAGRLAVAAANVFAGAVAGLLSAAATGADWWTVTARAGLVVADLVRLPQAAAVLVLAEVVGLVALYTLGRLLRAEPRWPRPPAMSLV